MNALTKWSQTYGHAKILGMTNIPLQLDNMVQQSTGGILYSTKIPSRKEWNDNKLELTGVTNIYTDGSKLAERVGFGIFCEDEASSLSYGIPDHCSIYQAEIVANE